MSHDVFISYKSEEYAQADWVRQNLEANGVSCWMAPESIPGGSNYAAEITSAMKRCRFVVLILSTLVQTSMWVEKEIELALNMQKKILPFMIEECALVDSYSFYLSNVQHYYAYQDKEQVLKQLIADIRAEKGYPARSPKIISQRLPKKQKSNASGWLGVVIGLLIAVIVILLVVFLGTVPNGIEQPHSSDDSTTTQSAASATTTEQGVLDGTTTSEQDQEQIITTTTPSEGGKPTTTPTVIPTAPPVIGEPILDTVIDYSRLGTHQTNLSRQTAAAIPFDGMIGGVLQTDTAYWYGFATSSEVRVHRVAGLRVNGEALLFDLYVTLYNETGMKQQEIYISRNKAYGFVDFILEPNAQYYLKVSSGNLEAGQQAGYGLFVSPRASDTGIGKEDATEIFLNEQYTFTLNSTLDDWLMFKPQEPGHDTYRITLYNIDVDGTIELVATRSSGGNVCSVSAKSEDSGSAGCYAPNGWMLYIQIGAQEGVDDPNGTYVIEVTTYY